jgi:hypothetical protein
MRSPDARDVKGGSETLFFRGDIKGPLVVPGTYQVRMNVDGQCLTKSFQIKKDPRISVSSEEFREQFDFLIKIRDKLSIAHNAVNQILNLHDELESIKRRVKGHKSEGIVCEDVNELDNKLASLLNNLVATGIRESEDLKFQIFSDPLYDHYAPFTFFAPTLKLNSKIANIKGSVESADGKPTEQCYKAFNELSEELDIHLKALEEILEKDVQLINNLLKKLDVPAISIKK